MSYKQEKLGDIVISGFEQGISNDPYEGISNLINTNLISVPKEASVNFSTSQISAPNQSGTMTTSSAGADTVTLAGGFLENKQAIQFSALNDATKGIALNTPYWVVGSGSLSTLYKHSHYNRIFSKHYSRQFNRNLGNGKYVPTKIFQSLCYSLYRLIFYGR